MGGQEKQERKEKQERRCRQQCSRWWRGWREPRGSESENGGSSEAERNAECGTEGRKIQTVPGLVTGMASRQESREDGSNHRRFPILAKGQKPAESQMRRRRSSRPAT